ncbi:MAG TPA: hypothetical protein QGF95_09235 [Candidatus Latescibacteria bacterium]|nr:hypothetical protein [Candidatus Latescibacterota bacterium]
MLRSCIRPVSSFAMVALVVVSCGTADDETTTKAPPESPAVDTSVNTAYGTVAEVAGYLETVNPHITAFGVLQVEYEEALASSRKGNDSRKGTGHNLAMKAASVRPGLQTILEKLDGIEPPPLLAPFHRDTRKMLATRIDALGRTIEGWDVEQAGGAFEAVYAEAEAKYEAANQLILQLNTQMNKINTAMLEATGAS